MSPPPQTVNSPPDMSGWNPFGEDNFSKLTEEELLDREFDLLRASKCLCFFLCLCSFESVLELHPDVHPIVVFYSTPSPAEGIHILFYSYTNNFYVSATLLAHRKAGRAICQYGGQQHRQTAAGTAALSPWGSIWLCALPGQRRQVLAAGSQRILTKVPCLPSASSLLISVLPYSCSSRPLSASLLTGCGRSTPHITVTSGVGRQTKSVLPFIP